MNPDKKTARATRARESYHKDLDESHLYAFIKRVRASEKYRPRVKSMERFGLTIEAINDIRKERGWPPLERKDILGQAAAVGRMVRSLTKRVTADKVASSVVGEVHVVEPPPIVVKKSTHNDLKEVVDIPMYLSCIRYKLTNENRVRNIENYMRAVLKKLGYSGEGSIVPTINKDPKGLIDVVQSIKPSEVTTRKAGADTYSPSTRLQILGAFSTGAHKDACPAYAQQLSKRARELITTTFDIWNAKDKETRETRKDAAEYPDWKGEIMPTVDAFLKSDAPSNQKALVGVYFKFGGMPRIATMTNMHYVRSLKQATDRDKNYVVAWGSKTILVSHDHKTGVSSGRTGSAILIDLSKHKSISGWVRESLAAVPEGKILWPRVSTTQLLNRLFKKLGGTNTTLRHSHETWLQNNGSVREIARGIYINAHTLATARRFYAKTKNFIDISREFDKIEGEADDVAAEVRLNSVV